MEWSKVTRYQSTITINHRLYNILCESDFDGGFAIYVNHQFVADVETLPTEDELRTIIADNIEIETSIKSSYAGAGVFE